MPVNFSCNISTHAEQLRHYWKEVVGSVYATLCLRAEWQKQLTRCHEETCITTPFNLLFRNEIDGFHVRISYFYANREKISRKYLTGNGIWGNLKNR